MASWSRRTSTGVVLSSVLLLQLVVTPALAGTRSLLASPSVESTGSSSHVSDGSSGGSSEVVPGFEGTCYADSESSSAAGPYGPFFVKDYYTCVAPGTAQASKAVVTDASGAATVSGLSATTISTTTLNVATINPPPARRRGLKQDDTVTIAGSVNVAGTFQAAAVTATAVTGKHLVDGFQMITVNNTENPDETVQVTGDIPEFTYIDIVSDYTNENITIDWEPTVSNKITIVIAAYNEDWAVVASCYGGQNGWLSWVSFDHGGNYRAEPVVYIDEMDDYPGLITAWADTENKRCFFMINAYD